MAELIDPNNYQDFTLQTLMTPDGITKINNILRQLSQNISGDTESVRVYSGVGTPEGSVSAGVGSLYMRTDGGADTAVYRKETGSGNTGWIATKSPASLPLSVTNGGFGADNSAIAKGYLPYMTATGVIGWLPIGSLGKVLTVGASDTIEWDAPIVPGLILKSTTTFSAAANSGTITLTPGKSYKLIFKIGAFSNGIDLNINFNADSGANYWLSGTNASAATTYPIIVSAADSANLTGIIDISPYNTTNNHFYSIFGKSIFQDSGSSNLSVESNSICVYEGVSDVNSIVFAPSADVMTGTIWTYEYSGT